MVQVHDNEGSPESLTTELLANLRHPRDVRALTPEQIPQLAAEIRTFLIDEVSRTGGHLGPNLGVVELTLAIHRVFESPVDTIIFDTGHQSYVHKLVTGRHDFSRLRQRGGLAGYPSRNESVHDVVENSHASTAVSWADGVSRAYTLQGRKDRHVVAVIGDGALTGGMAWEALNNIAAAKDRNLVIVINDNQRSYARTIGGLAYHLTTLRTTQGYERFMRGATNALQGGGNAGRMAYDALRRFKRGVRDMVTPQGIFEDLGIKYLGPVDGHDGAELEYVLRRARDFGQPVIVHAITHKGHGYSPAENDEDDRFHARGAIDPSTGQTLAKSRRTWTEVFGDEMVRLAGLREDLVGITAAMLIPVGLQKFSQKYPTRVFDVGIAEQHAVTSAAGMAFAGLHPVVAVYATFMNRAFDQVLMDCGLHRAGVTFVLDRAGITGDDGPSHHGMWDLSVFSLVPGIRIAAPRDGAQLCEQLSEAVQVADAPTLVRFPKGAVPEDVPALERMGVVDVLHRTGGARVLLVAVGALVPAALQAAQLLAGQGIGATVVDPRWVVPTPSELALLAREHELVAVVEDNVSTGGVVSGIREQLAAHPQSATIPVVGYGIPREFIAHATREAILDDLGLDAESLAVGIAKALESSR